VWARNLLISMPHHGLSLIETAGIALAVAGLIDFLSTLAKSKP
jgi:hypothetical protein